MYVGFLPKGSEEVELRSYQRHYFLHTSVVKSRPVDVCERLKYDTSSCIRRSSLRKLLKHIELRKPMTKYICKLNVKNIKMGGRRKVHESDWKNRTLTLQLVHLDARNLVLVSMGIFVILVLGV